MRPLNLKEFAAGLRVSGNWWEADFADEILDLIDIEEEVAEPYSDLCVDLKHYAEDYSNPDDAAKALEWIGDRSNLLAEIEKQLTDAGHKGDADDAVKTIIHELTAWRERSAPMEFDL